MSTPIPAAVAAFCDTLGLPPEATADVTRVIWGEGLIYGTTVIFSSCDAFHAACDARKAKRVEGRHVGGFHNPHRLYEQVDADGVLLQHNCFTASPCWEASS